MSTLGPVVVAGASGYIGRAVVAHHRAAGREVRTIGRGDADAGWDAPERVLDGASLLINFAGRSVSCRYTKKTTDEIFSSRVRTTAALATALARVDAPPPVWLNSSTGTIYRDARDHAQDERSGELGSGFSVEVARAWERELTGAPDGVRAVPLRMAIVIGAVDRGRGGAINPLINLARLGFGGAHADGGQIFSWIHLVDALRAFDHVEAHADITGPVNIVAPQPVPNRIMMRELRRALGVPLGLPLPMWALQAGGRIIRTEPELVTKSRWVDPGVLRDTGFTWEFPTIRTALEDIAATAPRGFLPVPLG